MWLECFRQSSSAGVLLGEHDDTIFYVFCAMAGVIVIISVVNMFMCCCVGEASSGFSMDFNIALGSMLLCFTVLVQGLNTEEWLTDLKIKQALCQIYPSALLIGLTQLIGGMFVKSWATFLYFKYNSEKRNLSEEWKPNLWIWFLVLISGAASLVWVFLFTPEYNENAKDSNDNNVKEHFECTQHSCYNEHEFEWKLATSAWHGFLLILACVAVLLNCFTTRKTSGYAEANLLGLSVLNTLLAVTAGICLHFLYHKGAVSGMTYAINGGLMLWICLFANIMFLVSKLVAARRSGEHEYGGDNYDTIKSDRSGTGISTASGGLNNPTYNDEEGGREQFNY